MAEPTLPIIDIEALLDNFSDASAVGDSIQAACIHWGFFYIRGHGVSFELQQRLVRLSELFFALSLDEKLQIDMKHGGRAWRGYFPVGRELTSGIPDQKEGLYFGSELSTDHPDVAAGTPLHGSNLFPDVTGFRDTVLDYIDALTEVGQALMRGLAISLELEPGYFYERYTRDPLVLFRIFHYPPQAAATDTSSWGVGEHTDYGILTILKQDDVGGLQVKRGNDWIDAPPIPGTFICNIGDMLDRMTGGRYRSTPHRVRNESSQSRYSFPFFFDPGFHTRVQPIDSADLAADDSPERWDHANLHEFRGTYGEYVLSKVAKVFPELGGTHL